MSEPPILPYAGTSGHAGSETSRERAVSDDTSGVTGARQRRTLDALARAMHHGLTYRELGQQLQLHHGQSSGVLSGLHKAGRVARLADTRRGRCAVYVLPDFVWSRPTEPHGNTARTSLMQEMADALVLIPQCSHRVFVGGCLSCRAQDIVARYEAR